MLKQLRLKIFGAAEKETIKEYLLCTIFTITVFSALIIGLYHRHTDNGVNFQSITMQRAGREKSLARKDSASP